MKFRGIYNNIIFTELGKILFCRVLSSFVEFCRVLPSFVEFCWVLSSFVEFCRVFLSFNEFHRVLPIFLCPATTHSFSKFFSFQNFLEFSKNSPSFTEFDRVLPSFREFFRVFPSFPSFAEFCPVLPSFPRFFFFSHDNRFISRGPPFIASRNRKLQNVSHRKTRKNSKKLAETWKNSQKLEKT